MKILPQRAAECTGNADEVLEAGQLTLYGCDYQVVYDRTAFGPESIGFEKSHSTCEITDNYATKSAIPDENVCSRAQKEVRNPNGTREYDGVREFIRGHRIVQEIGWAADSECGVGRERHMSVEATAVQDVRGSLDVLVKQVTHVRHRQ